MNEKNDARFLFLNRPPICQLYKIVCKMVTCRITQCLYFKLLTTMSSLRQILIQFHNLCDYTGQSQNLSQFLFGSDLRSCGRSVNYLRKYMEIIEKCLDQQRKKTRIGSKPFSKCFQEKKIITNTDYVDANRVYRINSH